MLWILGLCFTIAASFAGTWGKVKLSWIKTVGVFSTTNFAELLKHKRLALSLIFVVEPVLDAIAISLTSQSIMIPFNSLTLVFLLWLTPRMLHREITSQARRSTMCIGLGCIIVAMTGNHSTQSLKVEEIEMDLRKTWVHVYAGAISTTIVLCSLFVVGFRHSGRGWLSHRIVMGTLGGLLSGNLFLLKIVIELFKDTPRSVWSSSEWWIFVALSAVCGWSGSAVLSLSLDRLGYPVEEMVPLYQASFILTGTLSAGIVFGDITRSHLVIFLCGLICILMGMISLFSPTLCSSSEYQSVPVEAVELSLIPEEEEKEEDEKNMSSTLTKKALYVARMVDEGALHKWFALNPDRIVYVDIMSSKTPVSWLKFTPDNSTMELTLVEVEPYYRDVYTLILPLPVSDAWKRRWTRLKAQGCVSQQSSFAPHIVMHDKGGLRLNQEVLRSMKFSGKVVLSAETFTEYPHDT